MTNLDGQCQGGPEGEKYPKTTRTGKVTKKQKRSLEESCESLIVCAADGREERRRSNNYLIWSFVNSLIIIWSFRFQSFSSFMASLFNSFVRVLVNSLIL